MFFRTVILHRYARACTPRAAWQRGRQILYQRVTWQRVSLWCGMSAKAQINLDVCARMCGSRNKMTKHKRSDRSNEDRFLKRLAVSIDTLLCLRYQLPVEETFTHHLPVPPADCIEYLEVVAQKTVPEHQVMSPSCPDGSASCGSTSR